MKITIEKNELDDYMLFSSIMGWIFTAVSVALLILGAAWDAIALRFLIHHSSGYGLGQIIWMGFWAIAIVMCTLYIQMTMLYWQHYGA